jgi:hypothetical protein
MHDPLQKNKSTSGSKGKEESASSRTNNIAASPPPTPPSDQPQIEYLHFIVLLSSNLFSDGFEVGNSALLPSCITPV